jgi:hypothetical protein
MALAYNTVELSSNFNRPRINRAGSGTSNTLTAICMDLLSVSHFGEKHIIHQDCARPAEYWDLQLVRAEEKEDTFFQMKTRRKEASHGQ